MPNNTHTVSLRDFIDERFRAIMAAIQHEADLREQDKAAIEKALQLQAAEYERRLLALNHEDARARETQMQYMPREKFDTYVERQETWRESVNVQLAEQRGARQRQAVLLTIAMAVLALLQFLGVGR